MAVSYTHLRSKFNVEEEVVNIQKFNKSIFVVSELDMTNSNDFTEIETRIAEEQKSLNIEEGKIGRALIIKTLNGDHLFLTIHHLVIDGISWRIFIDDFKNIYSDLLNGHAIELNNEYLQYHDWVSILKDYANSKELLNEIPLWSNINKQMN